MKKHSKFFIFLTVFMLTFSSTTCIALAEERTNYITVEQFQSMMDELYSKYDSSFVILDNNDVEYISMDYAEQLYQKASVALEEMATNCAIRAEDAYKYSILDSQGNSVKSRAIMPIYYYDSDTFSVSSSTVPLGSANFKIELRGTLNAQYNSFITLNSTGIYQSGLSCNYDGFSIVSQSNYYSNNNRSYIVSATMDVRFSYTDPIAGLKFGETVRYYYVNKFRSVDGIE